ncbi:MAG: MoaD/ThiS family protein [Thermodesulfobacteriota bacterium]|nr:MoaD/ThiS family protein [Thermodesulfobacteriota bacterium]
MAKIIIPFPLRKYADNRREVIIGGDNLKKIMELLLRQYPGLETINHDSALLSIFINNRLIRTGSKKWDTLILNNEDEIALIIPIAGG